MAFKMKGFSGFKQTEGNQGKSPAKKRKVSYKRDEEGNVVKTVTKGREGVIEPRKIKTKTYSKDTGKRIHKKVTTDKYDEYQDRPDVKRAQGKNPQKDPKYGGASPRHVKREVTGRGMDAVITTKRGSYDGSTPKTATRRERLREFGRNVLGVSKQDADNAKAAIAKGRVERQNKKVNK